VGKIVFWLVVIFLGLFVLRMYNLSKMRKTRTPKAKKDGRANSESMVRCVQCGVFLPRPEARESDTGFRCQDPACARRH
jgi:hypothetical protein